MLLRPVILNFEGPLSRASKIHIESGSVSEYCLYGGAKYQLQPNAPDCYIKQGGRNIGFFETMTLYPDQLHIDHFAVDTSLIGKGHAVPLLKGFSALVKEQAPQIKYISFDLGRATSGSDITKLAQARAALFQRIGAIDVQQKQPNPNCIVVSATWEQTKW
jgi:predicted GNAT family acetyltransferase